MAIDAYAFCPCGSGQKFKWCCQPYSQEIVKAHSLAENGQPDLALKVLDDLLAAHPKSAEIWGRRAELLLGLQRFEEVQKSIEKALEINPKYGLGHFMKGVMAAQLRGDYHEALGHYRTVSACTNPSSESLLGNAYFAISQLEFHFQHFLAVRKALDLAISLMPGVEAYRTQYDALFGPNANLPAVVTKQYVPVPPPLDWPQERRQAWEAAIHGTNQGHLSEFRDYFEPIAKEHPQQAGAWYNLAIGYSWLGQNLAALEALERYLELVTDEQASSDAIQFSEVLRLGFEMVDHADRLTYKARIQLTDPQVALEWLKTSQHMASVEVSEELQVISGYLLNRPMMGLNPTASLFELPTLLAVVAIGAHGIALRSYTESCLEIAVNHFRERLANHIVEIRRFTEPREILDELRHRLFLVRPNTMENDHAIKLLVAQTSRFYEKEWIEQPLRILGKLTPLQAASGTDQQKRKLRGLIDYEQHLSDLADVPYDFNRLRARLGLGGESSTSLESSSDIASLGAEQLDALPAERLTPAQMKEGFQSAIRQDAREIAGKFALALVVAPPEEAAPDRYTYHSLLIQLDQEAKRYETALGRIDFGLKDDADNNQGRRQNDFELLRARVLTKQGDIEAARDVYLRLADRLPGDVELLGKATEAMLSARRGPDAQTFAERGLAESKKRGDRSRIGYFEELLNAARRG